MGYSHYWQWETSLIHTENDRQKFAQWSRDLSSLVIPTPSQTAGATLSRPEFKGFLVCGPNGDGHPILTNDEVALNGDSETGIMGEAFWMSLSHLAQSHFWAWCKTRFHPYDLLVTTALVRFYHYFPAVALWSDGEEAGLDDGAALCRKVFGVGANPLRDLDYQEYVHTIISNWGERVN
ncbi:MAG TPA: hypothetical protein VHZ51_26695 [Ktedonobacteraceae bacterium]|jgi:hypothetical protein|nr:hypothetical protein [Ktedonobacteraceae bacterium]